MDLESATVQRALSKKFPRKRCFKEVGDCFGISEQPEKIARINTDTQASLNLSTSASPARNEKQLNECEFGRLRSLSPGIHDPYEGYSKIKTTQYPITSELENSRQPIYGKPCNLVTLVTSGKKSSHLDFETESMPTSLLAANRYIASKASFLSKNTVHIKSINNNSNVIYSPASNYPNGKKYIHRVRTSIPSDQSVFIRPTSSDLETYENAIDSRTAPPITIAEKSHQLFNVQRPYSHIGQLNGDFYKQSYLAPLCDLPCSSPITFNTSMHDTTNSNPMCLRTASTVIVEAMANKVCSSHRKHRSDESESEHCSRHLSVNSSPTSSKSSMDSAYSRQHMMFKQRYRNAFQSAHRDLLGGMSMQPYSPVLGEPPELIRISSDDGDYADDSPSDSEGLDLDDTGLTRLRQTPDTSNMSVDEILGLIRLPNLSQFTADLDCVKRFLEPHQIGHINHLIKCYADAIFTVNVPSTVFESKIPSAIDYLDIHMSSVLQIYSIMFKSEDFLSLNVTDQVTLLQSCVLPAHIALGFPLYKPEKHAWAIPSATNSGAPFTFCIYNMLQILPKSEVSRLVALHETSHKLNIDWTISVLLLFIFMFTPIKRKIFDMENIENVRNTYVQLLYKYLEWKCGPQNAPLVFPEILKLMDAILRLCQDIEDFQLRLKEEDVESVQTHIKCFNLEGISPYGGGISENHIKLAREEPPMSYISYSSIHSKMSSVLLKSSCMASSEIVSTDCRIPLKISSKRNTFMESYENFDLAAKKIRQYQTEFV